MRKLFTLALVALFTLVGGVNAQEKKSWDLRNGFSATSIDYLTNSSDWTNHYDPETGIGYFESKVGRTAGPITCKVGEETIAIPEFEGLSFGATSAQHLNIVIGEKNLGPHVWLNGKKGEDCVTVPNVPAGEKVYIIYSSHKNSEARGFKTSGNFKDEAGKQQWTVSTRTDTEAIPDKYLDTVVVINTGAEAGDMKLQATSGMHFHMISIGEMPTTEAKASKIAYLYSSANGYVADNDAALNILKDRADTEVKTIDLSDAATTITLESLNEYDVTVISSTVPAEGAAANKLKGFLPFIPVLNLNGSLYDTWGYGTAVDMRQIEALQPKNELFKSEEELFTERIEQDENENEIKRYVLKLSATANMKGVQLGDYFKNSKTLAVDYRDANTTAIHTYSLGYNGYIFLPVQYGVVTVSDAATTILSNAITLLTASKDTIRNASAPTIMMDYKDMNTNVIINAPKQEKAKVYYTLDGSDPTEQSTLYTDTINVTTACTVKAAAIAEGYNLSKVVTANVSIFAQPKAVTVDTLMENGSTMITLSCETDSADIWYNFAGVRDTTKSTKYIDSLKLTITMPQDLTTFAAVNNDGKTVYSELSQQRVLVKNPRVVIDVISHFSAKQWTKDIHPDSTDIGNNGNIFGGSRDGATMYIGEPDSATTVIDPATLEETIKYVYSSDSIRPIKTIFEPGENPTWVFKSRGSSILWQNNNIGSSVGDDGGYNPISSTDIDPLFPVSKNNINFYKTPGEEPINSSMETLRKFEGPFDLVIIAGLVGSSLNVMISTDSVEWRTIKTLPKLSYSRMWGKYMISYDEQEPVYIRLQQEKAAEGPRVFDVFIAVQGEKSQTLLNEINDELKAAGIIDGISEVSKAVKVPAGIYNLSGVRQNIMRRGFNIIVNSDGSIKKVMVK